MELENVLTSGFEALGITPDAEALRRYRIYFEYLEEMNAVMNLTAISGETEVARLHFLDSAALLTLPEFGGSRVLDVGTGAGFPGLALKIARPELSLTLLDSLDKRINFLKNTCERLGLDDVECIHARAEEAPADYRGAFDVVTSRAVARLALLCELCIPMVKRGGAFIAMKGPDCAGEIQEAKRAIALLGGKLERVAEYTVPGTDIIHSAVVIRKLSDTPSKYPRRWAQMKKQPL